MINEAYAFEKIMKREQDIPTPGNAKNKSELEYHEITLEEAIQHLKDSLSDDSRKWSCEQCRHEHEQLLEWLEDLKRLRITLDKSYIAFRNLLYLYADLKNKFEEYVKNQRNSTND